jgi:cytochrome c biogenesis protein CcdA
MANLTELLPVGYAFAAGMVASVNPCGFFMLPSYGALASLDIGVHQQRGRARKFGTTSVTDGEAGADDQGAPNF